MWSTVELREIKVFLALCEELHFARTAERLQLTPSRISQIIRNLEAKLGTQLVHRTTRAVTLTPSGERFRARVNASYTELADTLEQTRAESDRLEGALRLALFSAPAGGPHLKTIIDTFETRHPNCTVETCEVTLDDLFGPLTQGETPLMATWLPHGLPDLVVGPILNREPRVLLVAPDHPLAAASSVSAEVLSGYRVARFDHMPREFHDAFIPAKTPAGRTIPSARVDMVHRDFSQFGMRIARGEFVHPTIPSAVPLFAANLTLAVVPIDDLPPWESALVWRRRCADARTREFVRVATEILASA